MKYLVSLPIIVAILLISACSPHPASGVWATAETNSHGISRVVVDYGGRAEFVTTKLGNITWHCFWATTDKKTVDLQCAPSTDPDKQQHFSLAINDQGLAEFSSESELITTLDLQSENPTKALK